MKDLELYYPNILDYCVLSYQANKTYFVRILQDTFHANFDKGRCTVSYL